MIQTCRTAEHWKQLVADSQQKPVFLLKHSTRCPISSAAWRAFQAFAEQSPAAALWKVLVVEDRSLSKQVAEETGVAHRSPQLILMDKGEAVWHTSHWSITVEAMEKALAEVEA